MTPLAIRMCRSSNGVSEKHGEVSRELWLKMFPDLADPGAVPITSVTNGVHPPTWIAPAFQHLYRQCLGGTWHEAVRDEQRWAGCVNSLDDSELWATHQSLKGLLIAFIRNRTHTDDTGDIDTIHEHEMHEGTVFARHSDHRFRPARRGLQTLGPDIQRS